VRLQALGGRIVFTKAEDVTRVKTDAAHFWSSDTTSPMQRAFGGHTLMRKDGCPHLRERRAMMPALTPEYIQHWQPTFEELTNKLLDQLATQDTVDLSSAFASPLSTGYLKIVLGLDEDGADRLFDWATALVHGAMNASNDPKVFAASDRANAEMNDCFDRMIKQHRASPDGSVLSTMTNAEDPIELSQIRTNMKICIGGAVIETRDALLSTLYGLLSNPDQLRDCIASKKWGMACEEGLRWVAPIQASPRIVKKALVMRGLNIPQGETVMAIQASADLDRHTSPLVKAHMRALVAPCIAFWRHRLRCQSSSSDFRLSLWTHPLPLCFMDLSFGGRRVIVSSYKLGPVRQNGLETWRAVW
jgi:cytochrome P450